MRDIKFKFLMENGEITDPYYLIELICSDSYINIECEYSSKIKQELQYTGLKDKNGIEIYEGDIVKVSGTDENNDLVYRICEVVFNKGSYVFKFQKGFYFYHNSIFEVIGNIYENPELLENK